jgi:hypothetical protein
MRLKVDLLVPSPDETYPTIKVPELNAYAQGLPYLKYVLSNSQEAPILKSAWGGYGASAGPYAHRDLSDEEDRPHCNGCRPQRGVGRLGA